MASAVLGTFNLAGQTGGGPGGMANGRPSGIVNGGADKAAKEQGSILADIRKNSAQFVKGQEGQPRWWSKALKTMGIQMGIAGILKQSQIFTSTLGSLFQILGAFVDVILAPWIPMIIPGLRKLANQVPRIRKLSQTVYDWVTTVAWPLLRTWGNNVSAFLDDVWGGLAKILKDLWNTVMGKVQSLDFPKGFGWIGDIAERLKFDEKNPPKENGKNGNGGLSKPEIIALAAAGGAAAVASSAVILAASKAAKTVITSPVNLSRAAIKGMAEVARTATGIGTNRMPGDLSTRQQGKIQSPTDRRWGGRQRPGGGQAQVPKPPVTPRIVDPSDALKTSQGYSDKPPDKKILKATEAYTKFRNWLSEFYGKSDSLTASGDKKGFWNLINKGRGLGSKMLALAQGTPLMKPAGQIVLKFSKFVPIAGVGLMVADLLHDEKAIRTSDKSWFGDATSSQGWQNQLNIAKTSILGEGGTFSQSLWNPIASLTDIAHAVPGPTQNIIAQHIQSQRQQYEQASAGRGGAVTGGKMSDYLIRLLTGGAGTLMTQTGVGAAAGIPLYMGGQNISGTGEGLGFTRNPAYDESFTTTAYEALQGLLSNGVSITLNNASGTMQHSPQMN